MYLFAVAAGLEPTCEHVYAPLLAHSLVFMLRQVVGGQTAKISELLEREPGTVLVQKERAVDGVIRAAPAGPRDSREEWRVVAYTRVAPEELEAHARSLPPALSLPRNNCWTFAASLVSFAEAGGAEG